VRAGRENTSGKRLVWALPADLPLAELDEGEATAETQQWRDFFLVALFFRQGVAPDSSPIHRCLLFIDSVAVLGEDRY
jgi:hypothetical protein